MKKLFTPIALVIFIIACSFGTIKSNTTIKPYDQFILGNNEHGKFKVRLTNNSKKDIEVYHAPIGGGKHSGQIVKPNETVTVKIDKNTALIIDNSSADTVTVSLKVTGDVGLSMGYKK
jgi:hypothetical protein